jgi:hypothetical protein
MVLAGAAIAGPPFQTDDPEPVDFHHYEAYIFSTFDRASGDSQAQIPAFEFNVGTAPNVQLHAILPMALSAPASGPDQYGVGDMELGVKYRFLQERNGHPQVGVFPLLEVPTGDARRGLGNGQAWARLPLWIQKSMGHWTTYGGGGYTLNTAPGMRSAPFAGWLLQRDLNQHWTLGGEAYGQGASTVGGQSSTFLDGGGYYNVSKEFQVLFMLGHTVAGERHLISYLGLYWTWK